MYTDFETAFVDKTSELDKIARDINNKKKDLYNSVYNDYNQQKIKWNSDIKEFKSDIIHPKTLNSTDIDYETNIEYGTDIESISIDSPELDSIIDSGKYKTNSISNYVNKNYNKKNKNKNIACKNIKPKEDIFLHIKNCYDCRDKLIKYLKMEYKEKNGNTNKSKTNSIFSYFGFIESNEIIVIIVIGIIVIFILDFLMKSVVKS